MKHNKTRTNTSATTEKEISILKEELHKLQLERDILKQSIELLKKEMGADITKLSNRDKAIIISALVKEYTLFSY